MCYIGVCSLVGSLSVMSVKAIGISLKLTLSRTNQLVYPQTWAFTVVVILSVITQLNYLNKVIPCVPSTMANTERAYLAIQTPLELATREVANTLGVESTILRAGI